VCDGGLLPDVMHDILEGALQYEVKLLLKRMIGLDNYFTLGETFKNRYQVILPCLYLHRHVQFENDKHWAWIHGSLWQAFSTCCYHCLFHRTQPKANRWVLQIIV